MESKSIFFLHNEAEYCNKLKNCSVFCTYSRRTHCNSKNIFILSSWHRRQIFTVNDLYIPGPLVSYSTLELSTRVKIILLLIY